FPPGPEVRLEPGDSVLLLTDGVVEARDPEGNVFGAGRALDVLRTHRAAPAREVVDHLHAAVRAFARNHPQLDDVTATVIKVRYRRPTRKGGAPCRSPKRQRGSFKIPRWRFGLRSQGGTP